MSTSPRVKELLIATVGESPQVVTRGLDELLRRGYPIRRVLIVQPSEAQEGIRQSLTRLRAEEAFYQDRRIKFDYSFFEDESGYRPADTATKEDAVIVMNTLSREIEEAKDAGWRVHLLFAGGRKIISAYGAVAAQLHFEEEDLCWHVIESQSRDREAMHVDPDEQVALVDVLILSWRNWKTKIAGAPSIALTKNPIETERLLRQLEATVERAHRLRDFYFRELNYTEQRVLSLLALTGLDNDELGERLGIQVKNNVTNIGKKYGDFIRDDVKSPRLVADFQQIMLALQFQGKLHDLTPAGAKKLTQGKAKSGGEKKA